MWYGINVDTPEFETYNFQLMKSLRNELSLNAKLNDTVADLKLLLDGAHFTVYTNYIRLEKETTPTPRWPSTQESGEGLSESWRKFAKSRRRLRGVTAGYFRKHSPSNEPINPSLTR